MSARDSRSAKDREVIASTLHRMLENVEDRAHPVRAEPPAGLPASETRRCEQVSDGSDRALINQGLFTSEHQNWETPLKLFRLLDAEFGFELDVCATPANAKCHSFFSPETDGLRQMWRGVCWMNPPYGAAIGAWMAKAYQSSLEGAMVVCLVPSRTDTKWWHEFAMRGELRFLQGRVSFGNGEGTAPFPSAIVIFRPKRYLSMALTPPRVAKRRRKARRQRHE